MSYNPNIPVVTDFMTNSEKQIRANFQAINQVFSKNHVNLNSDTPGNSQGMHNVITFRHQTSDPTTAIDQIALYTKLVSTIPALFFRPSNNQTPIQLTYPSISTGLQSTPPAPDVYLDRQYSFLAGPFVFYFGRIISTDGLLVTLTPSTTLKYVGLIIDSLGGTDLVSSAATNISGNQFTIRLPAGVSNVPVFYLAIGI